MKSNVPRLVCNLSIDFLGGLNLLLLQKLVRDLSPKLSPALI